MIDFNKLTAPFPPDVVSWRVGPTTQAKDKGMALAYIDARDVMERLDEVCSPVGWQCRYPHANGKTVCEIGISCGDEWIWKADGAGDTGMEAEKGALSDAFKRAAVRWGIGRYLYDVPAVWVVIEKKGASYVIKDSEIPKLRRTLGPIAPAQPVEPTESEKRIADQLVKSLATVTDLTAWKSHPANVEMFKDIPPSLQAHVQKAATERLRAISQPITAAG